MHRLFRKLMSSGLVIALFVAGCSSGDQPPQLDNSPEAQAYQMRDGLMNVITWKLTRMRMMADGDVPADEAVFIKDAQDLVALTGMAHEGFIPNSAVPGSRALPAIWDNWDDFAGRSADFQNSARSLADAAGSGGIAGSGAALRAFSQTCGNCHRSFRAPD